MEGEGLLSDPCQDNREDIDWPNDLHLRSIGLPGAIGHMVSFHPGGLLPI